MSILIVDDDPTSLLLLSALARQSSALAVVTLTDPAAALEWCVGQVPLILLVDYRMEDMNGIEFIARFRAMPALANVPIIMITSENERSVRQQALAAGATDFLSKPIDPVELRLRLRNLLALSQAQTLLAKRARVLQEAVEAALAANVERELELVMRLSRAAAYRDPDTGAHLLRMARYSALIAQHLALPAAFQRQLLSAAAMHDVGNLATPDAILLKPGRLSGEEMAIMRRHAEQGALLLGGSTSPLLQLAEQIARGHHERYDGTGYPDGLAGPAIALSARIVAVADVFDALTSARPYKPAWPLERARDYLQEQSGRQFCPACVHAFVGAWQQVLAIHGNDGTGGAGAVAAMAPT